MKKRPYPTTEEKTDEAVRLRQQVDDLRTVLRSLISCGGTSPIIKATAMNTLEAGSGDTWLAQCRDVGDVYGGALDKLHDLRDYLRTRGSIPGADVASDLDDIIAEWVGPETGSITRITENGQWVTVAPSESNNEGPSK